MKNPFREISTGGMMMFALIMLTFGSYTIISIFLLLWIPGFLPMGSFFFPPLILFILLLLYCFWNIRFYNNFYQKLLPDWRRYFLFIILLFLPVSFFVYIGFVIVDVGCPQQWWGQFFGACLIVCLFGLLPIPPAFRKSKETGYYAVLSLLCTLFFFLVLSLAWKTAFFCLVAVFEIPRYFDIKLYGKPNDCFSLFGQQLPILVLHPAWLTAVSLFLLPAVILLYAKVISGITGEPLRKLFQKQALYPVVSAIACWLLFSLLSSVTLFQVESLRKEIQKSFGRYPSVEKLNDLYFAGQKPDKAFWDFLEKAVELHRNGMFKTPDGKANELYEVSPCHFLELTCEEKCLFRNNLEKTSSSLAELDKRLESGIPKFPLEIKKDQVIDTSLLQLNIGRSFCRQMGWRTFMALESGNQRVAFRSAEHTRKMAQYFENEIFLIGALIGIDCYKIYFDSLEQLVEKHALTREQIQIISQEFFALEKKIPQMEKNLLYSELVSGNDVFCAVLSGEIQKVREVPIRIIPARRLPVFFPQIQWIILRNQAFFLRAFNAENFEKIPDITPSNQFAYLLIPSLGSTSIKFRQLIVRCRAERVILACELFRMDTGKYPTSASELVPKYLDKIPDDPFNGKPLLFRTGELTVEYGKIAKDYYYLQTVPKKIKGLQVWSVGQNGIDNDGIFTSKNKDDPRALIRTQ